ncbi:MAG: Aminodeoxychorismate lyase [Flavobacterium sp. SCGC AAA160-P02]|nr:MAG: Aminodeoxychorismate lyase [Flavobacterium sp. SCGC AAA160-P02]
MLNYNGTLISNEILSISPNNRAFKFGDAVFEIVKIVNGKVIFWEDHYFRLMASMRMLRMKIPMDFTLEFLEQEILKTLPNEKKQLTQSARLTVTRKDGGLYLPRTNKVDYLIQLQDISYSTKLKYSIDLYKDFFLYSGYLSTVNSNNKLINTLASIFAEENELDDCILLNERKGVVEVTDGNIFLVKDNIIKTPPISEGCLKGIIRGKVIEILLKHSEFTLEESIISPFEIQKADEIFITNSIIGIQPVTNYRKKTFSTFTANKIAVSLKILEVTAK